VERELMPQCFYTPKQLEVESWINEFGLRTQLEKIVGQYSVDIFIPEINMVVEVDGKQHYKKEIERRDKVLKEEFEIAKILHIPFSIKKEEFDIIFGEWIDE
jgi:very-short-patch-repair endonuclease